MLNVPPLPGLRELVRDLRDLNEHCDGGWTVGLCVDHDGTRWIFEQPGYDARIGPFGAEEIPGDGGDFDAVAAARRLLAACRDGLEQEE